MATVTDDLSSASRQIGRGALHGIRILDLTQVMSGPYCTMLLADLGADVIKVENPKGGDQTRKDWGYAIKGEDSRAFLAHNSNKRSVCIDGGLKDFQKLVRSADVVFENFRPGSAKRLCSHASARDHCK